MVELAIVLVIIGLIVGGVLTGQDLIRAATVNRQNKQFVDYIAAINVFRTKYNCMPGDCPNAVNYFAGSVNGNGNELFNNNIDDYYDLGGANWSSSNEYQYFFVQLSVAGLVAGSFSPSAGPPAVGVNVPSLALNPSASFFPSDSKSFVTGGTGRSLDTSPYRHGNNWLWVVACNFSSDSMQVFDDFCGIFKPQDISNLDAKYDDGQPLTGNIIGFGGHTSNNDCLTPTNGYKVLNDTPQCQAAIRID